MIDRQVSRSKTTMGSRDQGEL